MACGPWGEWAISWNLAAIVFKAISHEIGSNWPEPLGPVRRSGVVSRSLL